MKKQKEKLIDILSIPIHPRIGADYTEVVADYLLDNDVLPVVRCKDCKYWEVRTSNETAGECMCGDKSTGYGSCFFSFSEDFCSYGERKDVIQT